MAHSIYLLILIAVLAFLAIRWVQRLWADSPPFDRFGLRRTDRKGND